MLRRTGRKRAIGGCRWCVLYTSNAPLCSYIIPPSNVRPVPYVLPPWNAPLCPFVIPPSNVHPSPYMLPPSYVRPLPYVLRASDVAASPSYVLPGRDILRASYVLPRSVLLCSSRSVLGCALCVPVMGYMPILWEVARLGGRANGFGGRVESRHQGCRDGGGRAVKASRTPRHARICVHSRRCERCRLRKYHLIAG